MLFVPFFLFILRAQPFKSLAIAFCIAVFKETGITGMGGLDASGMFD
jgi:hypothetical protein